MFLAQQFETAAKITREGLEWEWYDQTDKVWRAPDSRTPPYNFMMECIQGGFPLRAKVPMPLSVRDFPPISLLRMPNDTPGSYLTILEVNDRGVTVLGRRLSFDDLRLQKWEILRPGTELWEPV